MISQEERGKSKITTGHVIKIWVLGYKHKLKLLMYMCLLLILGKFSRFKMAALLCTLYNSKDITNIKFRAFNSYYILIISLTNTHLTSSGKSATLTIALFVNDSSSVGHLLAFIRYNDTEYKKKED